MFKTWDDVLFWSVLLAAGYSFHGQLGGGLTSLGLPVLLFLGFQDVRARSILLVSSIGGSAALLIGFLLPGLFNMSRIMLIHILAAPMVGLIPVLVSRWASLRWRWLSVLFLAPSLVLSRVHPDPGWWFWPMLMVVTALATLLFTWPKLTDRSQWFRGFLGFALYWNTVVIFDGFLPWGPGGRNLSSLFYLDMWQPMTVDVLWLNIVLIIHDNLVRRRSSSLWPKP